MNPSDFGADIFDANAGRRPDDDPPDAEPKAEARTTKKAKRSRRKAALADSDPADTASDPANAAHGDTDLAPSAGSSPGRKDETSAASPPADRRRDGAEADEPGPERPEAEGPDAEGRGSDAGAPRKRRRRKRPADPVPDDRVPADRVPAAEAQDRDDPEDRGGAEDSREVSPDRSPAASRAPAKRGGRRRARADGSDEDQAGTEREDREQDDADQEDRGERGPDEGRAEDRSTERDERPSRHHAGESDDDVPGRRRRRRRRRGRGEDEGTASEGIEPRADTRRPLPRSDRMIPVPTPDGELHGQRVAILVQLEPLLRQARDAGGELAFGKLLQQVAQRRHLIRAIAYADADLAARCGATLRGNGIEVHSVSPASDLPIAIAIDAMTLARRVDSLVLIPDAEGVGPLAAALRAQGVRVETASFTGGDADADELVQTSHRLGAESLFVP